MIARWTRQALVGSVFGVLCVSGVGGGPPARAQRAETSDASGRASPRAAAAGEASNELEAEARRRFEQGRTAYEAGDFEAALRHFQAAYERADVQARVFLLFNLAQVYDRLDRAAEAADYYEQYLRLASEGPNAGIARGRLRVLRRRVAARQEAGATRHAAEASQGAASGGEDADGRRLGARETSTSARGGPLAPSPGATGRGQRSTSPWWPWALGGALAVGVGVAAVVLFTSGGSSAGGDVETGGPVRFELEALR